MIQDENYDLPNFYILRAILVSDVDYFPHKPFFDQQPKLPSHRYFKPPLQLGQLHVLDEICLCDSVDKFGHDWSRPPPNTHCLKSKYYLEINPILKFYFVSDVILCAIKLV
jgi:hypothetical protein